MAENKKKILVIEDDKFFRTLISKKLDIKGFEIVLAADGQEAFSYLNSNQEKQPDLVLLDLLLPGLSGYEILSLLKGDEKTKKMPVIILSNLGQQDEIQKAISLGASDFMVKVNFSLDEVVGKIENILGGTFS